MGYAPYFAKVALPSDLHERWIVLQNETWKHTVLSGKRALGLWSVRLPLLAMALLLPVTFASAFYALGGVSLHEMDDVIATSVRLTIHIHVWGVYAAWRFPQTRRVCPLYMMPALLGIIPYGIVCLWSFPIGMLMCLTVFVPLVQQADDEQRVLHAAGIDRSPP